ncbi:MAG TPA: TetR/AcrR family transcriptional regulator [Methylophilaceae bacterium]|nr:TetR/AcrR family transcriptional regulator [Methylophilaceae bacterium]
MIVMKTSSTKTATPSRKEITHARILETAARAIRRSGYSGTGVADIMKEAGLTHGGFYAHFASRDEMLAEAANLAGAQTVAIAQQVFADAPNAHGLWAFMNAYLSHEHAQNIETGCAIAALCSEIPRQAPEVRAVSTRRIKEMISLIEGQLSAQDRSDARDEALLILSTMVGALMLARAVDDTELSNALRQAALNCHKPRDEGSIHT